MFSAPALRNVLGLLDPCAVLQSCPSAHRGQVHYCNDVAFKPLATALHTSLRVAMHAWHLCKNKQRRWCSDQAVSWMVRGSDADRAKNVSLLQIIHTGSGTSQPPGRYVPRLFTKANPSRYEVHSPSSNAEVNKCNYTSNSSICLHGVKSALEEAMKAQCDGRSITLLFL